MGEPDEEDPYGIVPPEFMDRFPEADTIGEALEIAGRQKSDTADDDRRRCPFCLSKQVSKKSGKYDPGNRRPETFKCTRAGCRRHFDKPADETTIPMTDDRTDPFSWIEREDLDDPDTRGEGPLFGSLDEERRIALAIVLYRPWTDGGPSLRELAPLFPHTRYWVGERTREWKAGDHRDLVGAPRREADPSPEIDASASVETAADGGTRRSRWAAYGSD
jgi:hypothetical protein